MLPLSAVAAITSCGNYMVSVDKSRRDISPWLVSSRLDYCNALLYGVADGLQYRRLQSAQNAAVRLNRVYGAVITSCQPYYVSTGCLCDSEYCS